VEGKCTIFVTQAQGHKGFRRVYGDYRCL